MINVTFVHQNTFFKLIISHNLLILKQGFINASCDFFFQIKPLNKDPGPTVIAANFLIKDALADN